MPVQSGKSKRIEFDTVKIRIVKRFPHAEELDSVSVAKPVLNNVAWFEATAREAFVTVENSLKKKSGLDSHGFDLATKALAFEADKKTGEIKKKPLVAINELKNESDRNEQDGIRYMLMGFFQGPRNLYQHNHIGSGASNSISVVIEASFFLRLLDGHSITKNGQWLRTKIDFQDMINKTPKLIDR